MKKAVAKACVEAAKAAKARETKPLSPQKQLDTFLDRYLPEISSQARACLKILRARLPGATQLVYDNYNGLVIGFGPSEKASEAIFSLVLFPRYLRLFFIQGTKVPDPDKVLEGSGNQVRSIKLQEPGNLDLPAVREVMAAALESAKVPLDPDASGKIVIRAIVAKQRPRRPA